LNSQSIYTFPPKVLWGIASIFLIGTILFAHSSVLNRPFHTDEVSMIVDDVALHRVATVTDSEQEAFTLPVKIYVALNWKLGGGSPWPYRLGGLLMHVGSVLLALRLISLLRSDTHVTIGSLAITVLLATHPGITEAINSIAAIPFVMAIFLLLVGFNVFLSSLMDDEFNQRWMLLGLTAFVIGLYIHPLTLVVPILVAACLLGNKDLRSPHYLTVCVVLGGVSVFFLTQQWAAWSLLQSNLTNTVMHWPGNGFYEESIKLLLSPALISFSDYSLSAAYPVYENVQFPWVGCLFFFGGIAAIFWNRTIGVGLIWLGAYPVLADLFRGTDAFSEAMGYGMIFGGLLVLAGALDLIKVKPLQTGIGAILVLLSLIGTFQARERTAVWNNEMGLWESANENCPICKEPIIHLGKLNLAKAEELISSGKYRVSPSENTLTPFFRDAESWYLFTKLFRPIPAETFWALERIYQFQRNPSARRTAISQGLQRNPEDPTGLYRFFLMSRQEQNYLETNLVSTDVDLPRPKTLIDAGRKAEAAGLLKPEELEELARILAIAGQNSDALNLLKSHPESNSLVKEIERKMELQSLILFGNDNLAREKQLFERVLRLYVNGRFLTATYTLSESMQDRNYESGEWVVGALLANRNGTLRAFIQDESFYPLDGDDQWDVLADALVLERNMDAAVEVLTTGKVDAPNLKAGTQALGYGFVADAVAQFETAINEFPNDPEPWLMMADAALIANKESSNGQEVVVHFLDEAKQRGASSEQLRARESKLTINK